MRQSISISEVYGITIQGEGPLMGLPTVFVRTGGCDYRCSWCDSMFAVVPKHKDEWEEMSADDVFERILNVSRGYSMLVSLSGGNPALQPLGDLIKLGHEADYTFALETQGTLAQDWFKQLDYLVLSPKPPSSGMQFNLHRLAECFKAAGEQTKISFKIVVFDEEDYTFARRIRDVFSEFPEIPFYLQAGTPQVEPDVFSDDVSKHRYLVASILKQTCWLAERVTVEPWFDVRVSCQLHVLLWSDQRGV